MKVNVFFVNGHTAIIASTVIAKALFPDDVNILIKERRILNQVSSEEARIVSEEYLLIEDILAEYFSWQKQIDTYYDIKFLSLKDNWNYLKYLKKCRRNAQEIKKGLAEFGPIDNIFASGNSQLWRFFYNKKVSYYLTEHGAGEYKQLMFYGDSRGGLFSGIMKSILSFLLRYPLDPKVKKIILTDGGRSSVTKENANEPISLSLDARETAKAIYHYFISEYRKRYGQEVAEIDKLKEQLSCYDNPYVYLPDKHKVVEGGQYDIYLEKQLSPVKLDGSCFLIKNHPINRFNLVPYFNKLGLKALDIRGKINRYIPAEILALMVGNVPIVGSDSSSLLYAEWWFGSQPIYLGKNSNDREYLIMKIGDKISRR